MANATLKPVNGRQYVLFAEVTIDVANMNESGVAVPAVIKLPSGAQVIGGAIVTETGFDAATATLAVGDALSANRYLAAGNIAAAGRVALVPTGLTDAGDISVTPTFADAVTVGKVRVQVEYVIAGRAHEVQPN